MLIQDFLTGFDWSCDISGSISIHPLLLRHLQLLNLPSADVLWWLSLLALSLMEMIGSKKDWQNFVEWSLQNHLQINSGKTKELVKDFNRQ